MRDLPAGLQLLIHLIQFQKKHKDFDRVTELAKEYKDIFSGQGIAEYLKKYRLHEKEDMFQQALRIYETTIPAVVDNLDTIFEKPLRSNKVYSTIEHNNSTARAEIMKAFQSFYHGQSSAGVDTFLAEQWKHEILFDPNAFIAIEFYNFDNNKTKAQPFPIIYNSSTVYNFNYINGILDWLLIELPIKYKTEVDQPGKPVNEKSLQDGHRYILYLEDQQIVFTQVDKDKKITAIENPVFVEIKDVENVHVQKVFVQEIFDIKSKRVPAFRVGYKLDPVTNKRTCISNIHHALPFFKKELKSGVELDLTIRGHVFPQKYMYGPKCEGNVEEGKVCKNGKDNNGAICSICKGSGVLPAHTTAQDVIVIPIPKKNEEPVINLQQAMAYFSPPMDLVKFMEEYCDRLTQKAKDAVFPSENIIQKTEYAKTATELDYSWETRYDALRRFAAKYSWVWSFIIKQIAIYTDNDDDTLIIYHRFPSDFKMKTIKVLLEEGKAAEEGHFPTHVKSAIHNDIANLLYADDQDTLTRIQIKNKFYPFAGKSAGEISAILNSSDVIPFYRLLYIYFEIIFAAIDNELGDKFYLMPYQKQLDELKKRVEIIKAEAEKQKAKTLAQTLKDIV